MVLSSVEIIADEQSYKAFTVATCGQDKRTIPYELEAQSLQEVLHGELLLRNIPEQLVVTQSTGRKDLDIQEMVYTEPKRKL